jgi:hypothetical protein
MAANSWVIKDVSVYAESHWMIFTQPGWLCHRID